MVIERTKEERQADFDLVVRGFAAQSWELAREVMRSGGWYNVLVTRDEKRCCSIGHKLTGVVARRLAIGMSHNASSSEVVDSDPHFWYAMQRAHDHVGRGGGPETLIAGLTGVAEELGLDTSLLKSLST